MRENVVLRDEQQPVGPEQLGKARPSVREVGRAQGNLSYRAKGFGPDLVSPAVPPESLSQ